LVRQAALVHRDLEPRGDNDRGPEPCPQIGEIAKNEITEGRRSDQLDIAERRDDCSRAALKGANDQVMPGTAEQAEAGEQLGNAGWTLLPVVLS
jgi:hypothetical protein